MDSSVSRKASLLLVGVATLAGVAAARAEVVYSNLGPGNSFDITSAWGALGNLAFPFVATGSGDLASVEAAIVASEGPGAAVITISVYTDDAGALGTRLDSSTLATTGTLLNPTLLDFAFSETARLTSGHTYWLDAFSGTFWGWQFNNTGVNTTVYYNGNYVTCSPAKDCPVGAFRVKAPEPGTLSLVALALAGLAVLGRRRRPHATLSVPW